MAIRGSIRDSGLADVCQLLSIGEKTGCLSVTDRSRFGQIFFDRGRITFATIVNRRDRLGDLLLREGAITHAQLTAAVEAQARQPDRRLGEILLDHGAIQPGTLEACVRRQIEEAIYFLFTWRRGDFHFEPGRSPGPGEILISVNSESLLLEGARRIDEWSIIEKKLSSLDLVFQVDRPRIEATRPPLTREQTQIIPLLDGRRSVHEVAEAGGLAEFEAGKALYGLIQAGFATPVGRREHEPTAELEAVEKARNLGVAFYRTGMLDDAEREFRRVLRSQPRDPDARNYLALVALRQGDPGTAVRRLTALIETAGPRIGVCLNLAYALRIQGRYADAARVLRDAGERAPGDARIRLAQGTVSLVSGDVPSAEEHFARSRDLADPAAVPPPNYYYFAALAAAVQGRLDDAVRICDEGLGAHRRSAPLWLLSGSLAEERADPAGAALAYQRAAEEDPLLPQPHRSLGDLAYRRGAEQDAIEHYRRAVEAEPDLGDDVYTRMAEIHYRRNERHQAVRCWRRAVELNPGNEAARSRLEVVADAAV
jgi:tetratricopeptide (TPR) repeat protein